MHRRWALFALAFALGTSGIASADEPANTQTQIEALQKQLDAVKAQLEQLKAQQQAQLQAQQQKAPQASAETAKAASPIQRQPGDSLTFALGRNDEMTFYGNLDLSYDVASKGLAPFYPFSGDSPVGNVGYQGAISTNLSYLGLRGTHYVNPRVGVVYQLETQIDVSATSGTVNTNSNNDGVVKGGLTSRNSYIGVTSKYVGALKIGKTDAPYKTSTAKMNPFSGELGDYSVIMGNTGGDNRVEFGTRLDHAIWYESPVWYGFTVNALVAPGQNRSGDNTLIASGESGCAGGNLPGSGALSPACNDGSYGTAYSASASYSRGPLYLTGAYEIHKKVNRSSDLGDPLAALDIADEDARKGGIQYTFRRTGTTVSGIYEDMRRYVPQALDFQNERSRTGTWLALTQGLTPKDNLNFGWGHANSGQGDPGQHNTPTQANADNAANLYSIAYKHTVDSHFQWYLDYAYTANHPWAHYDLGAGGRGITVDCHDGTQLAAFDPTTGAVSGTGPHCYAGGQLRGFSAGMDFRF
jgi:predicted porin